MTPDETVVRQFLGVLHERAAAAFEGVANPGLMQLVRIHPAIEKDIRTFRFQIGDVGGMTAQAVADSSAGYNVYVEGRTVKASLARNARGSVFDTIGVFALVTDSDADKGRSASAVALKPSLIVETSPGNEHHWYFLQKAQPPSIATNLGRGLRSGAAADSDTGNLTQPYRVAGTPNFPTEKKRQERGRTVSATSITADTGFVYSTDQFSAAYPHAEARRVDVPDTPGEARSLPELVASISDFRRAQIEMEREEIQNNDRSAHFFNVSGFLKGDGFTIDEVEAIWREFPNGAVSKYLSPRDRLRIILESDWGKLTDTPIEADGYDASILLENFLAKRARVSAEVSCEAVYTDEAELAAGGDWTNPGGLIEDIADWIVETAPLPNRRLALAASIAFVATVCSRHLASPTGSGLQLFTICTGQTGIGKDWPMKAIERLAMETGLQGLIQSGKVTTSLAIEGTITTNPVQIIIADEIGRRIFGKATHRRAGTYESALIDTFLELWSSNPVSVYRTTQRVQSSAVIIEAPAVSLFGVSTHREFYTALGRQAIDNGLINRMLIIEANSRAQLRDVDSNLARKPPEHILDAIMGLKPTDAGGNLVSGVNAYIAQTGVPSLQIAWATDAAKDRWKSFRDEMLDLSDNSDELSPFISRAAEMVSRLAAIWSLSRLGKWHAAVTVDAVEWAISLVRESVRNAMSGAREHIVDSDFQDKVRRVEKIVRGRKRVPLSIIARGLGKGVDENYIDKILGILQLAGSIEVVGTARRRTVSWIG